MALLALPLKRKFSPDDIFFQLGNLEIRALWLMKQAIIPKDQEYIKKEIDNITGFTSPVVCTQQPWCKRNPLYFPTAAAYESHYNASHRHVCSECKAVFPKQRFLELHLNEIHSTLVQLRRERGEKVYECFVEGCKKKFSTVKMRRLHTIDAHKYPKKFYFAIIKYGIVPYSIRRQQTQSRGRNTQINRQSASLPSSSTSASTSHDEPASMEGLVSSMSRMRLVPKKVSFGNGVPPTIYRQPQSDNSSPKAKKEDRARGRGWVKGRGRAKAKDKIKDTGNTGMEVDEKIDEMEIIDTAKGDTV